MEIGTEQYRQWREDFRQLNSLFWRIPILASTGVGGLWLGVATLEISKPARTIILLFAVMFCGIMMLVIWRLRMSVMKRLLVWLDEVEGNEPRRTNHIVASAFLFLLAVAGMGSFTAVFFQESLFMEKKQKQTSIPIKLELACEPRMAVLEERLANQRVEIERLNSLLVIALNNPNYSTSVNELPSEDVR